MQQGIDEFGCVGSSMKLRSGKYLDLMKPDPNVFQLDDIAVGLSRECRYGNQTPKFYSVAEHCVLMTSMYLDACCNASVEPVYAIEILMHDAAEAYLHDIPKPLKLLLPQYVEIESRVEAAIAERFALKGDGLATRVVKAYDRQMLKVEKTSMWPDDREVWAGFETIPAVECELKYWDSVNAEMQFRTLFLELSTVGG